MANPDPSSTFRILVASDIHLGYAETDPIRGNDSFVTFEEILSIAKERDVDFILHGGDLFHENKPSRNTLHACLSLLRQYCMGDKAVQFEYLSDQSADYQHCKFPSVNYEDPNLNIGIPMFSIHGNHDDPTGPGNLCSLDLLHTAGLVNYFGKYLSLDKIQISPVLLQKGNTRLSLYGLGSIRDERLHRIFTGQNVTMLRPKEHQDKWFNMFVLHQNRSKHSATNYIPEQFLEDFLDLVIWGHEHQCKLNVSEECVEWNPVQQFYVCQPGSSIATSLSEGETVSKHVGLLEIHNKDFRIQSIPLKSVRQFYFQELILSKYISPDVKAEEALRKIETFCTEKVDDLIQKAEEEHSGSPKQPLQPLIRLRVDYTGFTPFSVQRFGKQFVDRVANPKQIIHFLRKQIRKQDSVPGVKLTDVQPMVLDSGRVEDMVHNHFDAAEGENRLELLSEKGMGLAVKEFVEKEERDAIKELVNYQLSKTQDYLKLRNTQEDSIVTDVLSYKERKKRDAEEEKDAKEAIKRAQSIRESQGGTYGFSDEEGGAGSDGDIPVPAPTGRGKGRGRGRGSRGGGSTRGSRGSNSGAARGRGKKPVVIKDEDESLDETEENSISNSATSTRRNGRSTQAGKRNQNQKTLDQMMSFKSKKALISDSDEDAIILDDSDDDMQSQPRALKKTATSNKKRKIGNKGIQFTEISSEEEDTSFNIKPSSRRRK